MQQFAGLLQALPRNFAYGLKALIEQRGPAADGSSGSAADGSSGSAADGSSRSADETANPDEGSDAAPEPVAVTEPAAD
jgi:hypothetical protein